MIEFKISKGDYIELTQLLKAMNLVSSGAEAKALIDDGFVKLNGETEYRRRAKVRAGDTVETEEHTIIVV